MTIKPYPNAEYKFYQNIGDEWIQVEEFQMWNDASEIVPKKDTKDFSVTVLVYTKNGEFYTAFYAYESGIWEANTPDDHTMILDNVDQWMYIFQPEKKKIRIDGEPVVKFDFNSMTWGIVQE